MNRVKEIIHCNEVHSQGIKGNDIGIAILDTGISNHPDFENRIIAFKDILHDKLSLYDDSGHGTHVGGITSGNGIASKFLYTGVAPSANIISVKVLDHRGNGSIVDVLKGIEWILANRYKYNIRIINISVGMTPKKGDEEKTKLLLEGVEYAWDKGFVVVTAAGNNGPKSYSITTPGISRSVITVGSSDDEKITDRVSGTKTNYSSRGPTLSCICKPDIVTPGSSITSCNSKFDRRTPQFYCKKSGTSMATPVVSGAIALLLSKYPDMNNLEVKMRLRECAVDLGLPRNQQGWGLLDVQKLLK
ncbi:MAG TPA: S8 family peptidase [Candidatus Merdenecus merdavium]|nr:S8 family peptidase [Candidatus Merdenecus merdavium]